MPANSVAPIAIAESVGSYLEPGEEIVVVEGARAVDFWKGKRGILEQPAPAGVRFIKGQVAAVITTRRFLMFKIGGFPLDRAQELLTDIPVADVDSIGCESHLFKSFEVKLTIRGIAYVFVVPHIGRCHQMAKALEAAKRGEATAG